MKKYAKKLVKYATNMPNNDKICENMPINYTKIHQKIQKLKATIFFYWNFENHEKGICSVTGVMEEYLTK